MNPLNALYHNAWSENRKHQRKQSAFLTNVIYGYLVELLPRSTRRALRNRSKCASTIQRLMSRVINHYRGRIPPSAFIRALFLVLRFNYTRPKAVGSPEEALLLYIASFHRVFVAIDPTFSFKKLKKLVDMKLKDVESWDAELDRSIGREETGATPNDLPTIQAFFHFHLSGYVPICEQRDSSNVDHLPIAELPNDEDQLLTPLDKPERYGRLTGVSTPESEANTTGPSEFVSLSVMRLFETAFRNSQRSSIHSVSTYSFQRASRFKDVIGYSRHSIRKCVAIVKDGFRYTRMRANLDRTPRSQQW